MEFEFDFLIFFVKLYFFWFPLPEIFSGLFILR